MSICRKRFLYPPRTLTGKSCCSTWFHGVAMETWITLSFWQARAQTTERLMLFSEFKRLEYKSVKVSLDCITSPEPTGEGSLLVSRSPGRKLTWHSWRPSRDRLLQRAWWGSVQKPVSQRRTAHSSWRSREICLLSVLRRWGITTLSELRWEVFRSRNLEGEMLPPNRASLLSHTTRAIFMAMRDKSYTTSCLDLPPIKENGWCKHQGT